VTDAAEVADRIERVVATDARYAHTRNLLFVRRGAVVLERHFGPGSIDDLVDTYSMTKSVVATLAGIALDLGAIESLDDAVSRYLDGVRHPYTLRHLLTMTAGAETGGAWDIDEVMALPHGWVTHLLAAPLRHEPGTRFAYDNGAAHVLGAAVAAAAGAPLSALAAEHLFAPLGVERFEWPRDPDGRDFGFGHLRLRPRDIARLGELYLGGGVHQGRRVVSRAFVEEATRAQAPGGAPEGAGYGLFWWTAEAPFPHFFAGGYAGQSLTVIPHLELVAVTTGDESLLPESWRNARHAVLDALR
jgi:CubicO group peptidase (beta-lactamase class C family)